MEYLTKEQIGAAQDINKEGVDVPEWGGKVLVWSPTSDEKDLFDDESVRVRGENRDINLKRYRSRLCAMCLRDDTGERLFKTDAEVAALGAKSSTAIDRVFEVCKRLSKIREQDVEAAVKNSERSPSDDSSTASPSQEV